MLKWVFDIANHLKSVTVHDSSANGRRICGVLLILKLLFRECDHFLPSDISPREISQLFSMLHLKPDIIQSGPKFSDLNFLTTFIPDQYHVQVAKALTHFTELVLPIADTTPEWVFVIPLIHVFEKRIHPFDVPALTSDTIKWTDRGINLTKVNRAMISR